MEARGRRLFDGKVVADFCSSHRKETQSYHKRRQGQSSASGFRRGIDGWRVCHAKSTPAGGERRKQLLRLQNEKLGRKSRLARPHKKVNRCSFRVVYIEEFWEWAERYRSFIDFSKMEPLALGEEPDWVAEQRKKDFEAYAIQRKDPWGEDEDSRLKMLLSKHRYSWAEISEMMHRSHGAIARRCRDLGIKDRPVSMELTGKRGTWTSEDFEILADGIRHGDSYAAIGKAVGRSEKCVRSKVYNDYLTENADKVREMLGDGAWGHGAPEMDVRHGFYISRTRHQVRRDLSALATVLRKRMNDLGYDPYWQRFMCMNWDDIGGCSAGCTDCDSCTAFRRIQPQYCARCGGTFYERKENRFCAACRTARKKHAQRHWCRVNGMSRR